MFECPNTDLALVDHAPGLRHTYSHDLLSEYPSQNRVCSYLKYLSQDCLHVDIWDGDSLLPIGSTAIPMAALMRQGGEGSEWDGDCEIVSFQVRIHRAPRYREVETLIITHRYLRSSVLV